MATDMEIVGEVLHPVDLLVAVRETEADAVILDIDDPGRARCAGRVDYLCAGRALARNRRRARRVSAGMARPGSHYRRPGIPAVHVGFHHGPPGASGACGGGSERCFELPRSSTFFDIGTVSALRDELKVT